LEKIIYRPPSHLVNYVVLGGETSLAEIPVAPIERIAKKAGASRISDDAKIRLRDVIEEHALDLAAKANALARHANRKTVKKEDIHLAGM
jgi:histone H3/H4